MQASRAPTTKFKEEIYKKIRHILPNLGVKSYLQIYYILAKNKKFL